MSVDVRGHDTELDVHGVFSDGRGTCFVDVRAAVVGHVFVERLDEKHVDGRGADVLGVTCRSGLDGLVFATVVVLVGGSGT